MINEINVPTPHIKAKRGDFAETVLMPGDPIRSKFIAENYLDNRVLVNDVRGVQGYTGTYKGRRVSVMASGMGMPAIGIYALELYRGYGVKNIIRVGTMGGIVDNVRLRDIVIGLSSSYCSDFMSQYGLCGTYAPSASYELLKKAADICEERGVDAHIGNVLSVDVFYNPIEGFNESWRDMGVLGVEMETAALYAVAASCKANALGIFTVSDHLFRPEQLSSDERQSSLKEMIEIALDTATL